MLFFWNFLLRVGWERNGTAIFIFSISRPFPIYFDLKWSPNVIIWFFDFSSFFFLNFLLPVGYERNGEAIFISSPSRHFRTYFGLKWSHNGIFLIYWIFCYFSWIFSNASVWNETKWKFLFSLSELFPTNFGLKSRHNGIF